MKTKSDKTMELAAIEMLPDLSAEGGEELILRLGG